ncbi:MAG: glycosyltransferase family 9 protein [Actinomycetota bacterium]
MLPSEWQKIQRILAIRLDNVGDVVMLGPALRSLRHHLPNATIALMASPVGAQVAPLLPWIDETLTHRALWQDASGSLRFNPIREAGLIEAISKRRFDAALIFTSFSQSPYPPGYACYLAGIPKRIGQSKEFGGSVLSQSVKPLPDEAHQVDRNLFLLESAGLTALGRHLELQVPEEIQMQGDRLLRGVGIATNEPFIVLAPGASCVARRYDPLRYATVAEMLVAATGLPLVVVGSDREMEWVEPILDRVDGYSIVSLVGRTSIPELAAIIRRASLVIANDSGPMHIADAFQRPMVILFSGTECESQWQPRTAPAKLLRRPTDCSPCYQFRCSYQMECLDIPAKEVVSEALELLKLSQLPLVS